MCVPKRCPIDYVSCAASSACSWNATTLQCMAKGCPALWSEFSCLQDGACYWSHSSVSCISVPCSAYNGLPFDACPADRCSAAVSEVGTTSCNIKPCSAFLQDMCPKAYCVVTNSQCQQPPCASYTNSTTCAKSNCWWTLASTCAPIPCIKYLDDRTCTQNKCVFGADRVCTEPSCTTFTSSQSCASTLQCVWATSTMTLPDRCAPKPCEERFRELCSGVCIWNYTSTRCQKFWCSHFITAASCPPNQCQWDMGACAQSDCFATTTEAACASPCVFATRCVDPVIFRAPCYMINDTTRCGLQQPAGRCSWSAGVCIESFNQNTTTVVQPCYRYAAGSVCPNYCQALYGFCINPQCTKVIGNNVTCFNQGCRWNEVSRTCIDPNELNFPCHAYSSVTSCPARCKWNSTHCKGYETPSAPTQLSCGEYIDEEMCNATLRCWFTVSANGGSCTTRPCVGFSVSSCPLDRCRVPVSSCVAPCPSNLPHYCTNLGVCAASSDQCRSCSSTQVQCWDATCVTNMLDCKCPVATPHKCPSTGRCTANSSMCVTSCSSPTPVLCWNNVCAEAADNCPCPLERPTRCPGSSICVATASACATICPSFAPVRCWDGNCAANNQSCACDPQRPFRCRTNLRCYSSPLECPCPETSTPFRCNATFCSTTESDCGRNTCPTSTVQCQDGSCAASSALCCKDAQFVIPTISILGFDTTFDVTNWLRLMANATYVVCGQRQYLNITWKVYNRDTGAVWTGAGQLGQFTGVELAIPPNSIAHDTTYAVGVQTRAMNGVVASTSILISGYRPLPKLFIAGGNQVANTDVLNVAVDVQDRSWATADTNSFAWSCCSGRDCLEDCPSPVGTSLSTAQTKYVKIVGPIRAANYTVTVFFKGGNTTSTFWVRPLPTPLVQILNGATEVFAGDALPLYAIVQFSSPVVFSWFVNDTLLPLQNNRTITIPAAKLPAMYSTKITARASFGDRVGESSVIVRPSTKPWGSCSIEQVDGGVQSVSLQSQLQITGSWSGATTTLLHSFGFVDVDDRNNRRVVDITSFPQRPPSFTFTAPALVGTLASKNVEFFAKVWTDSRRVVGHVTCSHIIVRSTTAAVTAIAEQRTTLEGSRRTNDTIGALTALSNLAVVTSSDATVSTTERTAVGTDVVQQLEETMQQVGSTLSASQRTSVLQTLEQVVTTTDRSSATRILNQSVRQVLEVVRRVVETAATQLSVDVDAQAALNVLSQLPISNRTNGKDVTAVIEFLSRQVARNIQLGERQIVASTNVTLEAQRRSALDVANCSVGEKAVLKFPTSFVLPNVNETSVADLSAAQYVKDPYHGAGAPLNSVLSSTVSEFSLSVDGSDYPVRNASPPLTLRFAVNRTRVTPNTAFHCMYYDKEANQWVKTGVTFLSYDPVNGEVECSTVHLSTFGVFDDNTEGTSAPAGTMPSAAIIGGVIGGVLFAFVIGAMVWFMMRRAQKRKTDEEYR